MKIIRNIVGTLLSMAEFSAALLKFKSDYGKGEFENVDYDQRIEVSNRMQSVIDKIEKSRSRLDGYHDNYGYDDNYDSDDECY